MSKLPAHSARASLKVPNGITSGKPALELPAHSARASLKERAEPGSSPPGPELPAHSARASLKEDEAAQANVLRLELPAHSARASLKVRPQRRVWGASRATSRAQCAGLIEGKSSSACLSMGSGTSRAQCAGLIEGLHFDDAFLSPVDNFPRTVRGPH